MISVRIHSPAMDHLQVDFPTCDCTPTRRKIPRPECSSTSVAGFIVTASFWAWMTLSIMSMTSMSRSRDQTWITSVNGMVARDEGKDSMPGMLKVILMLLKESQKNCYLCRSILGKCSFKFVQNMILRWGHNWGQFLHINT